jgi:hypothetical protein
MADDEFALRRAMERAAIAQQLLENTVVKEAFNELEASYVAAWKASGVSDTEKREKLWLAAQIVGKVKAHLEMTAANGRLASQQIERDFRNPKRFGIV